MGAKNNKSKHKKAVEEESQSSTAFFVGYNQQKLSARFGKALKQKREAQNITQQVLAEKANLNRSYISEVERGIANISLDRAERLANALGLDLIILLK